jgi:hypothetical protein
MSSTLNLTSEDTTNIAYSLFTRLTVINEEFNYSTEAVEPLAFESWAFTEAISKPKVKTFIIPITKER